MERNMTETAMLSRGRIPDLTRLSAGSRRLRHRAPRHRPHPRALALAARDRRDRGSCRRDADRVGITCSGAGAGLTPKAFLQAITLDSARTLLRASASVLDAAYEVGLSGPGRLHDLFVTHEAMSPGEWKSGGQGLTIRYGFHPSPFGITLLMASERGLAGLAFADAGEEQAALADMRQRWAQRHICRGHRRHRGARAAVSSIQSAGAPRSRCVWC